MGGLSIVTSATASRCSVEMYVPSLPLAVSSPATADANCSRSAVLRNLPDRGLRDLVHELEAVGQPPLGEARRQVLAELVAVAVAPSRRTTTASGRSDHFSSGTAITAASATAA